MKAFDSEPLESEENFILGPKQLLDPYREDSSIDDAIKARFVDIESLNESQTKKFF